MTAQGVDRPVPARRLPSGRVTFVFTDIEGSTKLLKRLPDVAPDLFERHNELVRAAIAEHGGCEVNTDGDAFFIAFDDVDSALACCAHAQRLLAAERWPDGGEIRVRIGIHSGVAVPRNDDYVAMAVHQAARIVSTAHGGQIVAPAAALDDATGDLPGVRVGLGRFRIRDFDEPVELVRLDVADVPVVDRAPRATPFEGHNLVRPSTSFVGRESDADRLLELLEQRFIVSILGPGGIGKTRLAVEIGLAHASRWPDGVWMVELADLATPALVASAFAEALGLHPAADADVFDDVLAWAADRTALLIADNVETCVDACADLLPRLARLPGITVLLTSREPLNVPAEVVYRLRPLGGGEGDDGEDGGGGGGDGEAAGSSPGPHAESAPVRLFVDRARSSRPDFDPDPHLAEIAELCRRLDGLPLAIEIAAARVTVLTVPEILAGLTDRFGLLRSNERNRPQRQRRIFDLLQWSYDLLDDGERAAFRRLAVFGGSFTLDAAVAALGDPIVDDGSASDAERPEQSVAAGAQLAPDDVPELIWALVDKSLLVLDQSHAGTRYRLNETVRAFASEWLDRAGESAVVAQRSADDLLERVGPGLPFDRRWLGETSVELPNIRRVIDLLAEVDGERAQTLACSLCAFHDVTQGFESGVVEVSALTEELVDPTPVRVVLLCWLADLHLRRGDDQLARAPLDLAAELGARVGLPGWADVAVDRTRGEILLRSGSTAEAAEVARQALDRADLSDVGRARMWNLLGIASISVGDLAASRDAFGNELAIYTALDHETKIAAGEGNLAEVGLRSHDHEAASRHQRASLELALAMGQPVMLAFSSIVAAQIAAGRGEWADAVLLQAAGEAGLAAAGAPLYEADSVTLEQLRSDAAQHLDLAELSAQAGRGAVLDPVAAAEQARSVFDSVLADGPSGSTRRTDRTGRTGRTDRTDHADHADHTDHTDHAEQRSRP